MPSKITMTKEAHTSVLAFHSSVFFFTAQFFFGSSVSFHSSFFFLSSVFFLSQFSFFYSSGGGNRFIAYTDAESGA